jgi:exoribonuclease R
MLRTSNYQAFEILSHRHGAVETVLHTFHGANQAGRALPGDFVEWLPDEERCTLINRTVHPVLTGLLDVCSKTLYGMTSRHVPIFLFYPYDKRYPPMRVGCATTDRTINLLVTVRFEDWPQGETWPRANLENVLGPVGDLTSEGAALLVSASPFWKKKSQHVIDAPLLTRHKDLETNPDKPWHIFHIDPAGCRDVDDIIGLQQRPDGHTNILIGISDVAAYIPEGSPYDKIAVQNTSTVYSLTGTALRSMFPIVLSEDLFSLLPGTGKKPVVALTCIYDGNTFSDIAFGEYIVEVGKTYTYESIMEAMKAMAAPQQLADPDAPLRIPADPTATWIADTLSAVAASLARKVAGPQPTLNVGKIIADSHIWIEQLMVFYNVEAAKLLAEAGTGIYRSCEEADPASLEAVSQLPPELSWITCKPATYTNNSAEMHVKFGGTYCQATSPIRRYVDLYNQRRIKELLANGLPNVSGPLPSWQLINHLNIRGRQLRTYQRNLTFLTALLDSASDSKTVDATVVQITDTKARLYIHQWKTLVNTIEYGGLCTGDKIRLQFYYNPNRPNWKERIIFEIVA